MRRSLLSEFQLQDYGGGNVEASWTDTVICDSDNAGGKPWQILGGRYKGNTQTFYRRTLYVRRIFCVRRSSKVLSVQQSVIYTIHSPFFLSFYLCNPKQNVKEVGLIHCSNMNFNNYCIGLLMTPLHELLRQKS